MKTEGFCFAANKVKWAGEVAEERMKLIKKKRKRWFGFTGSAQKTFYKCDECGMYHFTSMTQDYFKKIENQKREAKKRAIRMRDEEIFRKYQAMMNSTPNDERSDNKK